MTPLQAIKAYYGDSVATRSGLPLMNHIYEGVGILKMLGANQLTINAYIIHPIVQAEDEDDDIRNMDCYTLAVEYRRFANHYLCKPEHDWMSTAVDVWEHLMDVGVSLMSIECAHMLLADKIQNKKDFLIHHYGTHERSEELLKYFDLWIAFLYKYQIELS